MARPIVLSNGELHVGINKFGEVHDFYYPYVGQENHAAGKSLRHKIGVWVEGQFSWIDDGSWDISFDYPHDSLIGYTRAHNAQLNILLEFDDAVDSYQAAFLRNIHVVNQENREREVKLFMHQVFDISDIASNSDTVQYLPDSDAILHYRGHRAFLVGGISSDNSTSFDQYTVGLFGIEGRSGTFADAEDGILSSNNVEHGRVDSTIGFNLKIGAFTSSRVSYWVAVGKTPREALVIDKRIREESVLHRILITHKWWRVWLKPVQEFTPQIEEKYRKNFIRSLLIMKAHMDNRGAIIASTDTTMLNYARDAYAYSWPRDGAYVIWPLIRLGYKEEPLRFFEFCRRGLHANGYLMHKYQADGALGSSWHPYVQDGVAAPPIQEDETATVLFVFAQYYALHKDEKLLRDFYPSFIKPMANFLASYVDEATDLPKPSYDLWEEVFLTSTYTTATVHAALLAATHMAEASKDEDSAVRWRAAADDISLAAHKYLLDTDKGVAYKGVRIKKGSVETDASQDSSAVFGAFMFGLLPLGKDLENTVKTLQQALSMPPEGGFGLARHENDGYNRVSNNIPGNPWFVTTLWLAQYYIATDSENKAKELLDWTQKHMWNTGVLSEQINPFTGESVSVAPLAWSQAEFVSTLLDLLAEK